MRGCACGVRYASPFWPLSSACASAVFAGFALLCSALLPTADARARTSQKEEEEERVRVCVAVLLCARNSNGSFSVEGTRAVEIWKQKKRQFGIWARVPDSLRLLRGACARATLVRLTLSLSLCAPLAERVHLFPSLPVGRCCQSIRSASFQFLSFWESTCTSVTSRPSHVSPSPTLAIFPVKPQIDSRSRRCRRCGESRKWIARARFAQDQHFGQRGSVGAKGGGASSSPSKLKKLNMLS